MRVVGCDLETHRIRPGMLVPRMVCVSFAEHVDGEIVDGLLDRSSGLVRLRALLADPQVTTVWHNGFYDLAVLCAEDEAFIPIVFEALEAGRVKDTLIREKLIDLAKGRLSKAKGFYTLAGVVKRRLDVEVAKGEETWRLRYADLDGFPIETWPSDARQYAIDDAICALSLWEEQEAEALEDRDPNEEVVESIPDETAQCQHAWAFQLMSVWGVRTDAAAVARLKEALVKTRDEVYAKCKAEGLVRADGSQDMAAITERLVKSWDFVTHGPVPSTPTGRVSTKKKHVLKSGDSLLKDLVEGTHAVKLLGTYVPKLEAAALQPLNPNYNTLLETGRTSCSDNEQTPPRDGDVRSCYVPRQGWVLASADYDTAEMRSWAQACLDLVGQSRLAALYQANPDADPHLDMAAMILGISVEEARRRYAEGDPIVVKARQDAKIPDFGLPGGMGEDALVSYAEGFGVKIERETASVWRNAWRQAWPENFAYFRYCGALAGPDGEARQIVQLRSGRVRGRVGFTQIANGFFQGLTADGAKYALWLVARECYVGRKPDGTPSPLAGSRPIKFLHDEIVMESPEAHAAAAAERLAEVMILGMAKFLSDVPVRAKPVLTRRWTKGAKPTRDVSGMLIPVEDVAKAA